MVGRGWGLQPGSMPEQQAVVPVVLRLRAELLFLNLLRCVLGQREQTCRGDVDPREGLGPIRGDHDGPHYCLCGGLSFAWCSQICHPISFHISPRLSAWDLLFGTVGLIPVLISTSKISLPHPDSISVLEAVHSCRAGILVECSFLE